MARLTLHDWKIQALVNNEQYVSYGSFVLAVDLTEPTLNIGDAITIQDDGRVMAARSVFDVHGFVTQPSTLDGKVAVNLQQRWTPSALVSESFNFSRRDGRICRVTLAGRAPQFAFGKHIGRRKKLKRGWVYAFACNEKEGRRKKRVGQTQENVTCLACLAK